MCLSLSVPRLMNGQSKENREYTVAVNFSRFSLAQPGFIKKLRSICTKYDVSPESLEIEITESIRGVEDIDLKWLIEELRQAGFYRGSGRFWNGVCQSFPAVSRSSLIFLSWIKVWWMMWLIIQERWILWSRLWKSAISLMFRWWPRESRTEARLEALRECGVQLAQDICFSRPGPYCRVRAEVSFRRGERKRCVAGRRRALRFRRPARLRVPMAIAVSMKRLRNTTATKAENPHFGGTGPMLR